MRRSLVVIASALLLAVPAALSAKPFVVVTEEKQGDQVSLYATLQNTTCVSFEMTLTLTNMKSSAPLPIVRDLTQEKTLLTTLTKINPAEKWSFKYRFRLVVGRGNARPDLAHVYKLPFSPESKFPLRSGYGGRAERQVAANEYFLSWNMPEGTPVLAAREGTVVGIRDDSNEHGLTDEFRTRANLIVIEHADGTLAEYVHLKHQGVVVKLGQAVKTGELIGYSGNTGFTRTPNLLVRISRVNPAATRESLAAIWDTKDDYRTRPRGIEEGKGMERLSSGDRWTPRNDRRSGGRPFPQDRRTIMSALFISIIVFAFVFGGALLGGKLRSMLPTHHLAEESRDIIKLAIGLLATLTALVLGLLVGSVKNSFDAKNEDVQRIATDLVLLDRILAQYGPAAQPARDLLRETATSRHGTLLRARGLIARPTDNSTVTAGIEGVQRMLRELPTKNRADELLQLRALEVSSKLAQTRWLLTENFASSIPTPFLAVVVSWLVIIFMSFGLFAPSNGTVLTALLICAASVSGALFLIIEMDAAFGGIIHVPLEPLTDAVGRLGK